MSKQKYVFCHECNALSVFVHQSKSARRYVENRLGTPLAVAVQSKLEEVLIIHAKANCLVAQRDSFCCPTCQDWFEKGGEEEYEHKGVLHCHQDCWHEANYGREEDPQYDHSGETPDLWDTHPEQMRLRQEMRGSA